MTLILSDKYSEFYKFEKFRGFGISSALNASE
jgi:hypothetical protein